VEVIEDVVVVLKVVEYEVVGCVIVAVLDEVLVAVSVRVVVVLVCVVTL
jgi:hypothetical protein